MPGCTWAQEAPHEKAATVALERHYAEKHMERRDT
jgi:hypothetical protein